MTRISGKQSKQSRLRVGKHRHAIMRFRGRRSRTKETVERVYSPRPEVAYVSAKAPFVSVAYKEYVTEQLPSGESTAILSAEYDPKTNLLWITFWGYKQRYAGSKYVFYHVPYNLWVAFNEAGSKGRFFYYNIRTRFSYSRVK